MAALPDGNDIQGVDNTAATFSLRSFVYTAGKRVLGTVVVDAAGVDAVGAGGTGVTQPTGGAGLLGWLSGIYLRLALNTPDTSAASAALNATLTTSAHTVTPNGYLGGAFDVGALAGGAIVVFEQLATANSAAWDSLNVAPLGGGAIVMSTSAAGRFEFIAGGVYQLRARIGTAGTGTVAISSQLSNGQKLIRAFSTNGDNLPVTPRGTQVTKTDRSGTITTGSTAQMLMAANAARRGLEIQNTHASADMYINEMGATAVIGGSSIKIPASALYVADAHGVPVTAVSIICATATATFAAREW
jgi:hypothetical protein